MAALSSYFAQYTLRQAYSETDGGKAPYPEQLTEIRGIRRTNIIRGGVIGGGEVVEADGNRVLHRASA